MTIITLDFETYFDKDYSLKKMTNVEYVRDDRFKVLGCSVAVDQHPPDWHNPDEFQDWVKNNPHHFTQSTVVSHNALFDALILVERYGVVAKRWGDTLALSRALLPLRKHSLEHICQALGWDTKRKHILQEGLTEASPELIERCLFDTEKCRDIYYLLKDHVPEPEHELISLTTRWGVGCKLELDLPLLEEALNEAIKARETAILESGLPETVLSSNQQFASALAAKGIAVPSKISTTTGQETEAFSKGDPEFQELMSLHPEHRNIWLGRLAAKSTLEIKRTERFIAIAKTGKMPMPLNYWGARNTGRWSGANRINCQNLPRGGALRRSIRAPKGQAIVVSDSAQIELRVSFWFSEQWDQLYRLATGQDIYKHTGSSITGKPVEEIRSDDLDRMLGKATTLGAGYGMGWAKFRHTCAGGPFGMDPIHLTEEQAVNAIDTYRRVNHMVRAAWYKANDMLEVMCREEADEPWRCVRFQRESILLPNGMRLYYPNLHQTEDGDWVYTIEGVDTKIYGGKLYENCLAGDTEVLTSNGWKPITDVQLADKVWDGIDWVNHAGLADNGIQKVIDFGGIYLTPNHLIQTDIGWVRADETTYEQATSSYKRPYRPEIPYVDGNSLRRQQWVQIPMEGTLRLRNRESPFQWGLYKERLCNQVMRMREARPDHKLKHKARVIAASCLRGLGLDDSAVLPALPSSLQKLRRAWNHGLPGMAGLVRELLGRHGEQLRAWVGLGQDQQQWGLLQPELSLDYAQNQHAQQTLEPLDLDPARRNDDSRSSGDIRDQRHNAPLPGGPQLASAKDVRRPELHQQRVYDLINAGPLHRFTVRGGDKRPILVHNCIQALARVVIGEQILEIQKRYETVSSTHDEIIFLAPLDEAEEAKAFALEVMSTSPKWAPDMPLSAKAGWAENYSK